MTTLAVGGASTATATASARETETPRASVELGTEQLTTAPYPGAEPGERVWELAMPEPADGPVTLTALAGPAPVAVYEAAGGELVLPPGEELPADGLTLAGGADEVRWAFAEPGAYEMALTDAEGRATAYEVLVTAPTQAGEQQPAAATERVVLDEGHVDLAARVLDGELQLQIKDGTVPGESTWREPSAVVLHALPASRREVPSGGGFDFLGAPGDPVWLLDQVQQDGLLWPGWSTENVGPGVIDGPVEFRLEGVSGPGDFSLFLSDPFGGPNVLFHSADGTPDAIDVPQNTHAHGGWAFTAEGVYALDLTMSGTLASGETVSDTETFTFAVGDVDPDTVSPPGGGGAGGAGGGGEDGGSSDGTSGGAGAGATGGTSGGTTTDGSSDGTDTGGGTDGTATGGPGGAMAETGAGASPGLLTGLALALAGLGGLAAWYATRLRRRGGGAAA
ncbi:choice-of-anchor M domain-containing protein [Streptomyces sp. 4N509B]|uniref:choice-of-anchor M domain-containing protein n=1 Tax=Streptomyces sp. 4N509B TaxID=3457413 RepID=UPI003FD597D9